MPPRRARSADAPLMAVPQRPPPRWGAAPLGVNLSIHSIDLSRGELVVDLAKASRVLGRRRAALPARHDVVLRSRARLGLDPWSAPRRRLRVRVGTWRFIRMNQRVRTGHIGDDARHGLRSHLKVERGRDGRDTERRHHVPVRGFVRPQRGGDRLPKRHPGSSLHQELGERGALATEEFGEPGGEIACGGHDASIACVFGPPQTHGRASGSEKADGAPKMPSAAFGAREASSGAPRAAFPRAPPSRRSSDG